MKIWGKETYKEGRTKQEKQKMEIGEFETKNEMKKHLEMWRNNNHYVLIEMCLNSGRNAQ